MGSRDVPSGKMIEVDEECALSYCIDSEVSRGTGDALRVRTNFFADKRVQSEAPQRDVHPSVS